MSQPKELPSPTPREPSDKTATLAKLRALHTPYDGIKKLRKLHSAAADLIEALDRELSQCDEDWRRRGAIIREQREQLKAHSSETAPPVADWYSEHTEAEMRREYQSATDHDAPDHIRGESFEKWAEAEGYIRGSALLATLSATEAPKCPHTWTRPEPQPASFMCSCGTKVYRSREDAVDD